MPGAFVACLVAAILLAVAEAVLPRLPAPLKELRRPRILAALGLGAETAAPTTVALSAPPFSDESDASRAALARINRMFVDMASGTRPRTRILWLGDSLIEGDLITSEVRRILQRQLGGRGMGLVPIALPTAGLRDTVVAETGQGWTWEALGHGETRSGPFGPSAAYAIAPLAADQAWVRYRPGLPPWRADLPAADLVYGRVPGHVLAAPAQAHVRTPLRRTTLTLTGSGLVNRVRLDSGPAAWLEVTFSGAEHLPLYGVSFESPEGVILDSFALRGSVGNELAGLPPDILGEAHACLRWDLLVLHFGVNVLYPEPEDYQRYRRTLRATIRHLTRCLPGVEMLVVSATDRGWRGPDGLVGSHPHLPWVVDAQRAAAADTGAAFFDLYRAMGAPGAMARWATAVPPLARKDFTHFNVAGARQIAGLLKRHLIGGHRAAER